MKGSTGSDDRSIGEDTDSALGLGDGGELDAQDDGSHDGELEVYLERAGSGNSSVLAGDGDDTFHLGEYDNDGSFTVEYADEDHADGDTINDFESGEDTLEFDVGDLSSSVGAFSFAVNDSTSKLNVLTGTTSANSVESADLDYSLGGLVGSFSTTEEATSALTDAGTFDLSSWHSAGGDGNDKPVGVGFALGTDGDGNTTDLWAIQATADTNTSDGSITAASVIAEIGVDSMANSDIAFV